jgi:PAS domain S-box-containing protein
MALLMEKGIAELYNIRLIAEEILKNLVSYAKSPGQDVSILKLLHELEVIEFNMKVDELLKAKEEAEIVSRKYADLYDFAPTGYFTLTNGRIITELNYYTANVFGAKRSFLKGRRFDFYISSETLPAFVSFMDNIFNSTKSDSCDIVLLKKDQLPVYVHLTGIISANHDQCNITMIDRTREQIAKSALRESDKKLKSLISNIPGAVYRRRIHIQGKIDKLNPDKLSLFEDISHAIVFNQVDMEYVSEKITEISGFSNSEFIDKKISYGDLLNTDDRERVVTSIFQAVTNQKVYRLEYRIRHKDGSWRWIMEYGNPVIDKKNSSIILEGIAFDNTEHKNVEHQLEQYIYANKELKQFAYTASHQLQEPIRTVFNFAKVIKEDYCNSIDNKGLVSLDTIQNAIGRMSDLIDNLLEVSCLGRNRKLVSVDIRHLLDTVISDLAIVSKHSEAIIEISDMPVIKCYEVEIRQLFQNLISNALKFKFRDTPVKISIRSERIEENWKFSVSDNGIGIAHDHYDKVFDIFKREHADEATYQGKGIGLAYCKKIIEIHQGKIWVESSLGKGSTFHFTIPVI